MKDITKNPEYRKEYETLKRKFSLPKGAALKEMMSTDEGRRKYDVRVKKWEVFKKKWSIVFMIGDKPVVYKDKKVK